MKEINIFIASSEELRLERLEIVDMISNLNNALYQKGIHIIPQKWEYFDSSMGIKRKQEEYNDKLRKCEICLVLFWTKLGMYTKEELDIAYQQLCAGENPQKLYVYFKDGGNTSPDLIKFRDDFPTTYGHFYSHFQHVDSLKVNFLLQFINYESNELDENLVSLKNSKVIVNGIEYADMANLSFASNNEEYKLLIEKIDDLEDLLAEIGNSNPKYVEKETKLYRNKKQLANLENRLWNTALLISKLNISDHAGRLQKAIDLFNDGNNEAAIQILDYHLISNDVRENIAYLKIGEEQVKSGSDKIAKAKNQLQINYDELRLRIKVLMNSCVEERQDDILKTYEELIKVCEHIYSEPCRELAILYNDAGDEYNHAAGRFFENASYKNRSLELYIKGTSVYEEIGGKANKWTLYSALAVSIAYISINQNDQALKFFRTYLDACLTNDATLSESTAIAYECMGCIYNFMGEYSNGMEYYKNAYSIRHSQDNDLYGYIRNIEDLANTAIYNEEYNYAIDICNEGLQMLESHSVEAENHMYSRLYEVLGNAHLNARKNKKAIDYYLKSLAISSPQGNIQDYSVECLKNTAKAYSNIRDYKNALKYFNVALKKQNIEYGTDHNESIRIKLSISKVYLAMGDKKKLKQNHHEIKELLGDVPDDVDKSLYSEFDDINFIKKL